MVLFLLKKFPCHVGGPESNQSPGLAGCLDRVSIASRVCWGTLVISATLEADAVELKVLGQPLHLGEALSNFHPFLKVKNEMWFRD